MSISLPMPTPTVRPREEAYPKIHDVCRSGHYLVAVAYLVLRKKP